MVLFAILLLTGLFSTACREETADSLPEPVKNTRVFEFQEKFILRAITAVLKERGFGEPQVDVEKSRVETDYVVQEDLRFKVVATVKKIDRKEREVTLNVITEEKSSSEWKPKKLLDNAQYVRFFDEIEMQIYRELSKGE